jgi:hypothetical protein
MLVNQILAWWSTLGDEDGFLAEMLWAILAAALIIGITAAVFPVVRTDITNAFNGALSSFQNLFGNLS